MRGKRLLKHVIVGGVVSAGVEIIHQQMVPDFAETQSTMPFEHIRVSDFQIRDQQKLLSAMVEGGILYGGIARFWYPLLHRITLRKGLIHKSVGVKNIVKTIADTVPMIAQLSFGWVTLAATMESLNKAGVMKSSEQVSEMTLEMADGDESAAEEMRRGLSLEDVLNWDILQRNPDLVELVSTAADLAWDLLPTAAWVVAPLLSFLNFKYVSLANQGYIGLAQRGIVECLQYHFVRKEALENDVGPLSVDVMEDEDNSPSR